MSSLFLRSLRLFRCFFLSLFLLIGLTACVTKAKQTEELLSAGSVNEAVRIDTVPFVEQSAGYCGPATLTMVMQWAGKEISIDEVAPMVYTPGMKGSLQQDLISASRRQGLMAVPIYGLQALLAEVKAGHPVIVFENLAVSWLPQWHYAVVFGYDLAKPEVLMHSGPEAFKRWDMRKFERSWMLADYWGLVVLPPDQLAVSADERANLTAAAGLEQAGKSDEALLSYGQILKKWPQSLGAAIGLGNILFAQKKPLEAVRILRQAAVVHSDSAIIWHNLAIAQGTARMNSDAQISARKAMQLVSSKEHAYYQKNLGPWLN